jgi:hypothetical protein
MRLEKRVLALAAFAIASTPAWCVGTITSVNNSNGAIGEDLVVGDEQLTTINGSTHDATVTVVAYNNGVYQGTATPGTTDGNGHFTVSGHATQGSVGDRVDTWFVGGMQVGQPIDYEVISVPNTLTVKNVALTTFPSAGCPNGWTFGIAIDITYQVSSTVGGTYDTGVPIVPYEVYQFFDNNNVPANSGEGPIGPVAGYSDSSETTNDIGIFHDVPVFTCWYMAFSDAGANQTISMYIGDNQYPVRGLKRFTTNSSSSGHGSITNGSDVSASR